MSPVIRWSDRVEDANNATTGFEPLTPDTYDFVIEQPADVGKTQKGNAMFTINPSVESGPRKNARIFHTFFVSDSGAAMKRYFFAPLNALGITTEFFKADPTDADIANAMQGKRFRATVVMEEGTDGVSRPRLKDFMPPQGAAPQAGVPQMGAPSQPANPGNNAPSAPAVTQAPQQPAPSNGSPWETAPPPPPAF